MNDTQERDKWLHLRVSESERDVIREAAGEYNVDVATLLRSALNFVIAERPPLKIQYAGKLSASGS